MISVVIPAYNSKDSIVETLNSVVSQTAFDLIEEVLVIDDGSTDETADIVKKAFNNIEKIRVISKSNGGVSSARNMGIKLAKGEWIALLDSDDVWLNNKIAEQVMYIKKHPEIIFIGCGRNVEKVEIGERIEDNLYKLRLKDILVKVWPHTSTALIKATVFDEVGMFNEEYKYAEDGELWNRIIIKHPIYYISDSLEIAGGKKKQFGERGLSANIKEMHNGVIRNYKIVKNNHSISCMHYIMLKLYEDVKYVRRIILTRQMKKKNNNS